MATPLEIQELINNFNSQIQEFGDAEAVGTDSFMVKGVAYTKSQIESEVKKLNKSVIGLKKVISPYTKAQENFANASAALARAKEIAKNPVAESPSGMSQKQANNNVVVAQQKVNQLSSVRDKAFSVAYIVPSNVLPSPTGPISADKSRVDNQSMIVAVPTGATGPTGPTPTGPAGPGSGTGVNTGTGTGTGKKENKKIKVSTNWEKTFREMFPTKTWMLDLDRSKYADVFKVIQEGVTNEAWLTPESQQRFLGQLDNTSFIKELTTTDMVRKVKNVVGDLGFDSLPFNSFLTKALNFGWKDDVLKQEVYKEAFRKDDQGMLVNPISLNRVKASNDYLAIKKIGTDFFSKIDDATVEQTLTGGLSLTDIQRQQRELAKTKYGHLANLLDQGFTMDSLTSSFKQQAAQLLEKDVNSIDMSQADYEQVINAGEPGQKRMMTTGEWEIQLRSDPRYNWGSTQNAKNEARQLSASISKAFGKVI